MGTFKYELETLVDNYQKLKFLKSNPNAESLLLVFEFWARLFLVGKSKNICFDSQCLNIFEILNRKSLDNFYEKGDYQIKQRNEHNILKKAIFKYARFIPLKFGRLRGYSASKIDNLTQSILYYKLLYQKCSVDHRTKNFFLNDIQNKISISTFSQLKSILPNEFFLFSFNSIFYPSTYLGSPICFLNKNWIKILFLKKELKLLGYNMEVDMVKLKIIK